MLFPLALSTEKIAYLKDIFLIPGLPDFEWFLEWNKYIDNPGDQNQKEAVEDVLRNVLKAMIVAGPPLTSNALISAPEPSSCQACHCDGNPWLCARVWCHRNQVTLSRATGLALISPIANILATNRLWAFSRFFKSVSLRSPTGKSGYFVLLPHRIYAFPHLEPCAVEGHRRDNRSSQSALYCLPHRHQAHGQYPSGPVADGDLLRRQRKTGTPGMAHPRPHLNCRNCRGSSGRWRNWAAPAPRVQGSGTTAGTGVPFCSSSHSPVCGSTDPRRRDPLLPPT